MAFFKRTSDGDPEKDALVRTIDRLKKELEAARQGKETAAADLSSRHDYSVIGLQDGILKLSPDRTIRYVNSCLAGILQVDKTAVTGSPLAKVDATDLGRGFLMGLLDDAAAAGGDLIRSATIPDTDGNDRHFHIRIRHTDADIQVVFEDISEQRRAERELAKKENQLREAQKMESLGTLAAGVAHDLNNLLTIIRLNLELLGMETELSVQAGSHFKEIDDTVERSSSLTRQLLLFSRRQVMTPEVIDIHEVIDTMLKMLGRIIGEDIEVDFSRREGKGSILADRGTVEQVILNLAVNARDAMPNGGRFTIAAGEVDVPPESIPRHTGARPGSYVRLAFSDTGNGIADEIRDRIFEPFFTTKETGKGTGLGLSVVYGIVKEHNGWIRVESTPGKGTVFFVYFPVAGAVRTKDTATKGPERSFPTGKTVLVIEDEPAVLKAVTAMLEADRHTVLTAPTALEGMIAFEQHKDAIELIICDVVLPDENGPDIVGKMTRDHPGMPVIFCSAYSDERSGRGVLLEKGYVFIQKPFTRLQLQDAVAQALRKGH